MTRNTSELQEIIAIVMAAVAGEATDEQLAGSVGWWLRTTN